jgi:hypothetical protein
MRAPSSRPSCARPRAPGLARKEYANGEPEKQGIESRNYQRYLDRVAELKAAVARAESDVAGIQRENRLPGSANAVGSASK